MRKILTLLLVTSGISLAEPTVYQEQNFSVEYPAGWMKAETPPGALALFRSPVEGKGLVVIVSQLNVEDPAVALQKMVAGTKDAAAEAGVPITGEKDLDINGTGFRAFSYMLPNHASAFSIMAVEGSWGYSLQGVSGTTDPAADPEIQGALHSFRLLAAVPATAGAAMVDRGEAYRAGELSGKIAIAVLGLGAVFLVLQRRWSGKRKPR